MILGFISDIHEDIVSLRKAFNILEREKCDMVVSLGDIVGFSHLYYPYSQEKDANECISLIRKNCVISVAGNHDLFTAGRIPSYNAGIEYPAGWFSMTMEQRMKVMKGKIWFYESEIIPQLTDDSLHYLRTLPEKEILETDGMKILFSHFLYPDISGSLRKRIDDIYDYKDHFLFMKENSCILSFAGHMHAEGFELVNRNGMFSHSFRKKRLREGMSMIGLPSVARGGNRNGTAIFDTASKTVKVIRIR